MHNWIIIRLKEILVQRKGVKSRDSQDCVVCGIKTIRNLPAAAKRIQLGVMRKMVFYLQWTLFVIFDTICCCSIELLVYLLGVAAICPSLLLASRYLVICILDKDLQWGFSFIGNVYGLCYLLLFPQSRRIFEDRSLPRWFLREEPDPLPQPLRPMISDTGFLALHLSLANLTILGNSSGNWSLPGRRYCRMSYCRSGSSLTTNIMDRSFWERGLKCLSSSVSMAQGYDWNPRRPWKGLWWAYVYISIKSISSMSNRVKVQPSKAFHVFSLSYYFGNAHSASWFHFLPYVSQRRFVATIRFISSVMPAYWGRLNLSES